MCNSLHHPGIQECPDELQQPLVLDPFGDLTHQFVVIDSNRRISPNQDQRTSRDLRRYTAAPMPPLDEPTVPVETRSCDWKTSCPTASPEPASPLLDHSIQHLRDAKLSLSGPFVAPGGSVTSLPASRASPVSTSSIARYAGDLSGLGESDHPVSGFRQASARRPVGGRHAGAWPHQHSHLRPDRIFPLCRH